MDEEGSRENGGKAVTEETGGEMKEERRGRSWRD